MRMNRTGVYLQLSEHPPAELGLGEHPPHRLADGECRAAFDQLPVRDLPQVPDVAGMALIQLLIPLLPRKGDLFRVDHDHIVAGVDMRCEVRFMFSA